MSNTRHANGRSPLLDGQQNPANMLGQSIAYHLAGVLGELVTRATAQPDCEPCCVAAKQAIRAYQVACKNAVDAGEETPALPEPPTVARSVTWQDGRPVCFEHVDVPVP